MFGTRAAEARRGRPRILQNTGGLKPNRQRLETHPQAREFFIHHPSPPASQTVPHRAHQPTLSALPGHLLAHARAECRGRAQTKENQKPCDETAASLSLILCRGMSLKRPSRGRFDVASASMTALRCGSRTASLARSASVSVVIDRSCVVLVRTNARAASANNRGAMALLGSWLTAVAAAVAMDSCVLTDSAVLKLCLAACKHAYRPRAAAAPGLES